MNLNRIAGPVVAAVNPRVTASLQRSIGSMTSPDGSRVPLYAPSVAVRVQQQPMQGGELSRLEGLNLQGSKVKFYVNQHWEAIIRGDERGGDVITLRDGTVYLIVMVFETWPGWSSVAGVLQD